MDDEDLSEFNCVQCGVNTLKIFEYYALKDDVWALAQTEKGMLCITCFESITKITLNGNHFIDYPINTGNFIRSDLLQNRINS